MSATNRGAKVVPHEVYETPMALVDATCALLPGLSSSIVLEPSAGSGRFVRVLADAGATVDAVEVRPAAARALQAAGADRVTIANFTRYGHRPAGGYDYVVGNPPFSHAAAHIDQGLFLLRPGGWLIFVLRLNYLAGYARWTNRSARAFAMALPLLERPDFTGDGGDATEYGLLAYHKAPRRDGGWYGHSLTWKPGASKDEGARGRLQRAQTSAIRDHIRATNIAFAASLA